MVSHPNYSPAPGATYLGNGKCRFLVWSPNANNVEVKLLGRQERLLPMQPQDRGYYELVTDLE